MESASYPPEADRRFGRDRSVDHIAVVFMATRTLDANVPFIQCGPRAGGDNAEMIANNNRFNAA